MASGTIAMSTSNPRIDGQIRWSSSSNGSAANSSRVTIAIYFKRNNAGYVSYGTLNTHVTCNGSTQHENGLYIEIRDTSWVLAFSKAYTVPHNSDGTKTCGVDIKGDSNFSFSFSKQVNLTLDRIPRYTSVSFQITEQAPDSLSFAWSTADNISKIVCQFNGTTKYTSGALNAKSGFFTVYALNENTTYSNIRLTVTRRDSGLTTTSDSKTGVTTYYYPTAHLFYQSNTVNSITLNWNSNFECDSIWIYNSGTMVHSAGNPNAASGTVTLTPRNCVGMAPGTSYSLHLAVRRKASGAIATSMPIAVSTLAAPRIKPDTPSALVIGSGITVQLLNYDNNASSLFFEVYGKSNTWKTVTSAYVSKGVSSKTLTPDPSALYAECPNSNELRARIRCTCTCNGSVIESPTHLLTARVDPAINKPTFTAYAIQSNVDTNINSVIGGTTNLLTGTGNLRLQFPAGCAAGLNAATISNLEVKAIYNNATVVNERVPYSNSAFSYMCPVSTITSAGNYTLQVNALDSRGNRSTVISKAFQVYAYHKPVLEVGMHRQNEFGEITYLSLKGEISKVTILNTQKNSVSSLKYRYAKAGTPLSEYTAIPIDSSVSGTNDNLKVSVEKSADNNYFLKLDNAYSYDFEFLLTDQLFESEVKKKSISQGVPAFATFDNGCSVVNRTPDFASTAKLQVGSDIMARDSKGKDVMVLAKVEEALHKLNSLLDRTYPVGSIYMSVNSTNPAALLGGTWVAWGAGRVPVSINTSDVSFNTSEKTGGSKSISIQHSHSVNSHSHGMSHTHTVNSHAHTTPNHKHLQTIGADDNNIYMMGGGGAYGSLVYSEWRAQFPPPYDRWWQSASARFHYTRDGSGGNTGASAPGTNAGTRSGTDYTGTATSAQLGSYSVLQPYITCYMWKRTA